MSAVLIVITYLVIWPTIIFMKKHLPISEFYATILFALFLQNLVDAYSSFRFQAWGFYDVKAVEFGALWIILGIYPAFTILIVNWYPFAGVWWEKGLYLLLWSVFSTGYEWLAIQTGIIWHIHWNLLCSFFLYPFIYYLLIAQIHLFRWTKKLGAVSPKTGRDE